jgi:hypothetical protein
VAASVVGVGAEAGGAGRAEAWAVAGLRGAWGIGVGLGAAASVTALSVVGTGGAVGLAASSGAGRVAGGVAEVVGAAVIFI